MRTLLVIAPNNALSQAIRVALDAEAYRIIDYATLQGDELRHMASSIDICIVDAELTSIEAIRTIDRFRRALPRCPMILYASHAQWDWEEDAYLLGVNHILTKPVRGKLLNSLMERILAAVPGNDPRAASPAPTPSAPPARERGVADPGAVPGRMLELLRNCSSILCHSLSAEPLLKEFVLLLREILGVNRAVIFLRKPANVLGRAALEPGADRLVSACAVGISNGVLGQFQLSLDTGIANYLFRSGRVLRRESPEAQRDPQIRSEFELLGTSVAIPVLDRESLVGVALFDGRVTGEAMVNEELALIFHLLEQLGLAIKNIWWHDQVSARHQMMFDILGQIKSGCVVVGRELNVLHANEIIREYFPRPGRAADAFEFTDLPQVIGGKVFESIKSGLAIPDFKFQPVGGQDRRFRVSISPFRKDHASAPSAALVVVEDCTATDRIHHLEIETANLRLVQQMAERLAHEIGNAVVPISTHQQLLDERIHDPDFQKSLAGAMEEGVKRVSRLVDQMRFLARDRLGKVESVPVKQLIEEAFREARTYHPSTSVLLQYESSGEPLSLSCDRQGLQHAFAEIILNALQANGSPSQVQVRTRTETDSAGSRWARIEVQDSGAGFSDEAAGKASEPFYTTRKVGLGLGLAVTNKIIQTHSGKLEIPTPHRGSPGLVRISLPLDPPAMPSPASSAN